jgi:hypothetical protein
MLVEYQQMLLNLSFSLLESNVNMPYPPLSEATYLPDTSVAINSVIPQIAQLSRSTFSTADRSKR